MAKQTFTVGQVLTAAQMTSLQQTALGGGATTAKTVSYVLVAADAGTVVQMNSASATTITVNTALFAQGDTVQIQNVGSGVCTVTAGTATVSTSSTLALKQFDAGSLYFNTTSAAIFFAVDAADGMTNPLTTTGDIIYSSSGSTAARLGIGTTGQVLNVASGLPAWATPSSGGGMTSIASGSLSGNSLVLSSIVGTYKDLILLLINPSYAGVATDFYLTANSITSYSWIRMSNVSNTFATDANSGFTKFQSSVSNIQASQTGSSVMYFISNYANTTANKYIYCSHSYTQSTSSLYVNVFTPGYIKDAAAITSLTQTIAGTTFAGGTYILYGVS